MFAEISMDNPVWKCLNMVDNSATSKIWCEKLSKIKYSEIRSNFWFQGLANIYYVKDEARAALYDNQSMHHGLIYENTLNNLHSCYPVL